MIGNMLLRSVTLSLAGGALALDRTAAFQIMVSRPIVTGPVIGFIMGNPMLGLAVGVILEILFIGDLPVGSHIPVHETDLTVIITALITVALEALSARGIHNTGRSWFFGATLLIPPVLLLTMPVNKVYEKADELTRKFNARFFNFAARSLENGLPVDLMLENMKGLVLFFTANALTLFITIFPLMVAAYYIGSVVTLPFFMYSAFAGCVILGAASVLNAVHTEKSVIIFSITGAGAALFWIVWG